MADGSDSSEGPDKSSAPRSSSHGMTLHVNVSNCPVDAKDVRAEGSAKIHVGHKFKVAPSEAQVKFQKLCGDTANRIENSCPHGFVKTRVFHQAVNLVDSKRVVVILGQPGDGKTELGYQILKHFQEQKQWTPLALTRPEDWDSFLPGDDETMIVFIDDMFDKKPTDWLEKLKLSTPGDKVKFVVTSQPHLYRPDKDSEIGSHGLFRSAPCVDSGHLEPEEKRLILENFNESLKDQPQLTTDEKERVLQMAPQLLVGFPQVCSAFFMWRSEEKKVNLDFFEDPLRYERRFLEKMAETDKGSFQVLVLAMLQGGHLRIDKIDEMSGDKKELAEKFCEGKLIAHEIGGKAEKLRKRYFLDAKLEAENESQTFSFLRQSMYYLVFEQVFSPYPKKTVMSAPLDLIVRFVRTSSHGKSSETADDPSLQKRPTSEWIGGKEKIVAEALLHDRLTTELIGGEFMALGHPSLKDRVFEEEFAEHFCKEKENVQKLLNSKAPETYLDVCIAVYNMAFTKQDDPLSFEHSTGGHGMLSMYEELDSKGNSNKTSTNDSLCRIAFMGLPIFATKVVEHATIPKKDTRLTRALTFACAAGDTKLCELLIQRGAKPQMQMVLAACSGEKDNKTLLDLLLKKIKLEPVDPEMVENCCRIAVQQGHANMLDGILENLPVPKKSKRVSPDLQSLYYCCLLQCHGKYVDHSNDAEREDKWKAVFDVLRKYGGRNLINPKRDLFLAAGHKSRSIAVALIEAGADPRCQHLVEGYTPLHVAVTYGGVDVVDTLKQRGAHFNIPDSKKKTPLHWLGIEINKQILSGSQSRVNCLMNMLEWVLNEGLSNQLSRPDGKGHTPLHYIFGEMEEEDIFSVIFQRKSAESYDKTAISAALCDVAKLLEEREIEGSDITDKESHSIMHTYVTTPYCQKDVLQKLLDFYKDINIKDDDGRTPLHMYMAQGIVTPEMVKFFLEKKAQLDCKDKNGTTPWMEYLRRVDVQPGIVETLLEEGIDVRLTDHRKWTVLHMYCCSENANEELLKLLIKKGADVEALDDRGRTALMILCDAGNICVPVVETLIKSGCPINRKDKTGKTALMWLCSNPIGFKFEVLELLLRYSADANITDQSQQSPLHAYVSSQPKVDGGVIKLLVEKGANANIADENGSTVLHHLAASGCATEVNVSALLDAETAVLLDLQDSNDSTPLHLACCHNPKLEVIKKLCSRMLTLDKVDKNGHTALHVYHSGWWPVEKPVVECLIKAVDDKNFVNKKDKKGRTALHLYCQTARQVNQDIDQDVVICHMKHGADPSSTDAEGSPPLYCSIS